jgi:hypothetical protein
MAKAEIQNILFGKQSVKLEKGKSKKVKGKTTTFLFAFSPF